MQGVWSDVVTRRGMVLACLLGFIATAAATQTEATQCGWPAAD